MQHFDLPSLAVAWLTCTLLATMYAAHCARPLVCELRRWRRARP